MVPDIFLGPLLICLSNLKVIYDYNLACQSDQDDDKINTTRWNEII